MRKPFIIILLCAFLGVVSCSGDSTLLYDDIAIGTVTGTNTLRTDTGLTYDVVEQTCEGNLASMNRVLIQCDILRKTAANRYDIRLKVLIEPLSKDAVTAAEGSDPISVSTAWNGGGYINLLIRIHVQEGSGVTHRVNLSYDADYEDNTVLHFTLHHDAGGEYYGAPGLPLSALTLARTYASFRIADLIPAGKEGTPIVISWPWHNTVNGEYVPETSGHVTRMTLAP